MEINLPFRLKDIHNFRILKTEANRIHLEKRKKIIKNSKNILEKEPNFLELKNTPVKQKFIQKPLSIISNFYKNGNMKSLSIDNSENDIYSKKKGKKSIFEDEYYIDKLKTNKFNFSLNKSINNKKKGEIKNKNNFIYNNYNYDRKHLIRILPNNKNESEKAHILNLPEVKTNSNISPNSFLDANIFFINLNKCLENFVNKYNIEAVDEFIKKQKKLFQNSPIKNNLKFSRNYTKIEKNEKNSSYNEDNALSLKKMLHIEPIVTNINGNIHEYNVSNDKNFKITKSRFNNAKKEEENSNKQKDIVLPNLIKKEISNSDKGNNLLFRQTFNLNNHSSKINNTDNNISDFIKYKNNNSKNKNSNISRNLHTISSNPNFTKSQKEFSLLKNINEKALKKYKIETNQKINKLIYKIPPTNYYSKDFYYYNIFPQNCGWLIKKCFAHRKKWKECHSNNTNLFDFKWKDVITIKDFLDFGVSKKQLINHYENHSCLSNKYKMFYNFSKFCENKGIDVFKYVPFTITFDYLNYEELNIYQENFKEIFNNINNYIFENDSINNQLFDRKKIPYRRLFPLDDPKMGNKFYCEIPKSHYAGKNLWIVKAPNLNRGRCIKIFDNYNEIIKFLNEMKKGNVSQYDNIKEKGCKIKDTSENNKADNNFKALKIIKEKEETKSENEDNKIKALQIIKEKKETKSENKDYNNKNKDKEDKEDMESKNNIKKTSPEKGINKEKKEKEKGDYQSDIIIIQKYIEKPFLYNGRKCDIRIWVLISHKMDVYIFKEGHLKASSVNYNINNNNSFIHLTNYSLQKYNENFSKYETGNEISFNLFQKYLDTLGDKTFNFRETIIPKFKNIIELTAKSSKNLINKKNRNYCFELFGYDFMMDEDKNIYLIEINTNPGLEISSEIIEILVPRMIEDALRITADDLFETEYSKEWLGEDGNYISQYHVDGYDDRENMWELICNINESNDKYICEDYYGFGYLKSCGKKKA